MQLAGSFDDASFIDNESSKATYSDTRRLRTASVVRARQNQVELAFQHGLQKFASPIAKARLNRIKPVVE
jgi:hypothetical protein